MSHPQDRLFGSNTVPGAALAEQCTLVAPARPCQRRCAQVIESGSSTTIAGYRNICWPPGKRRAVAERTSSAMSSRQDDRLRAGPSASGGRECRAVTTSSQFQSRPSRSRGQRRGSSGRGVTAWRRSRRVTALHLCALPNTVIREALVGQSVGTSPMLRWVSGRLRVHCATPVSRSIVGGVVDSAA